MNTLIIYAQIPESVDLYLIPNAEIDEEDIKVLNAVHGCYVNESDLDEETERATLLISDAFAREPDHASDEGKGTKWPCRWAKYKVEDKLTPITATITRVIHTGFYL